MPLTKTVAVAEDALLGARLFFVTPGPANQRVKTEFFNRFEQRDRLVHVAAFARMRQPHGATRHRVFDAAHNQLGAQLFGPGVTEISDLMEVVAGVDHQQRVGNVAAGFAVHKGFFSALEHHQRVFAAGEQQGRAFKGGRHLAQDEDGFFLQRIEMGVAEMVRAGVVRHGLQQVGKYRGIHVWAFSGSGLALICRPHSLAVSSSHHQRPARKSSPRLMARVQGAQPMLG